jgi:hypothetical protein
MKLWNQFNTAWLGISQMQREMLESHQQTRFPQSLMTRDFIKEMVNDLHGFCDGIAKHGLVDYQYGVAENDITIGTHSFPELQFQTDLILQLWRNVSIF